MFTTSVKKYELNNEERQAIRMVRGIIDELNGEDFFEEEPFDNYCVEEALDLINDLLDNDGSPLG